MRLDAGLSIRRLAAEAGIDDGYLGQVERGEREPSLTVLVTIATALGGDTHVRLYPGTGPRLRDPIQARIVEALLRAAHPRWLPRVEVAVFRPARGVIDVVLQDRETPTVVAIEVHSELRRLEQQLRWAGEKAASLPTASFWSIEPDGNAVELATNTVEPDGNAVELATNTVELATNTSIHKLLILRSARTNRELSERFAHTLAVAYPASAIVAYRALTEPNVKWPGSALLWATVDGDEARLLDGAPGVTQRP